MTPAHYAGPRVVIFALDSLEISFTRRGIQEGWLPNIADLTKRGPSIQIEHPMPQLPGSTWPTTNFGSTPLTHHVIFDRQLIPGTYTIADLTSNEMKAYPFWKYLSDGGRRSTISSIYGNRLIENFNGTQVVGWGCSDPFSAKLRTTLSDPPHVIDRIRAEVPRRRSGFVPSIPRRDRDYRVFLKDTVYQVGLQAQGLEVLMRETEWDFFYGAFCQPHEHGHLAWHRPDDIVEVYKAVDRAVGRLLEACPQDSLVFVMTPHGMADNLLGRTALDLALEQTGWLTRFPGRANVKGAALDFASSLYRSLPYEVRWKLGQRLPIGRWEGRDPLAGVDWSKTRAFTLPHDKTALIRLNLKGREPNGLIEPGAQYDDTIADLVEMLDELVDPLSGKRMVRAVERMDSLLGGPVGSVFPDLIVFWEELLAEGLASERVGIVEPKVPDARTGDHLPVGFLIGAGPGLRASDGVFEDVEAKLPDLAATILSLLDCPQPPEVTGSAIERFAV